MTRAELGAYLIIIGLCFVGAVGCLTYMALTDPYSFVPFLGNSF